MNEYKKLIYFYSIFKNISEYNKNKWELLINFYQMETK